MYGYPIGEFKTSGDLIEELQKYPEDMEVIIPCKGEDGWAFNIHCYFEPSYSHPEVLCGDLVRYIDFRVAARRQHSRFNDDELDGLIVDKLLRESKKTLFAYASKADTADRTVGRMIKSLKAYPSDTKILIPDPIWNQVGFRKIKQHFNGSWGHLKAGYYNTAIGFLIGDDVKEMVENYCRRSFEDDQSLLELATEKVLKKTVQGKFLVLYYGDIRQ